MNRDRAKANEQVARCRARKRDGLRRYTIVVNEVNLLGVLRLAGIIDPYDRDPEHERIQELLQSVIDTWVEPPDDAA